MRSGIEQRELAGVEGAGQDVAAHVGDQRTAAHVGERMPLDALDGFVRGEVDVGRFRAEDDFVRPRYTTIALRFVGGSGVGLSERRRLLVGLFPPGAGDDVIGGRARRQEVHRQYGELRRGAALDEDHPIAVADAEQPLERRLRVGVDRLKLLGAVAHFHDRHAAPLEIAQLGLHLLQNRRRQHGRPGVEIVNRSHGGPPRAALRRFTTGDNVRPEEEASASRGVGP